MTSEAGLLERLTQAVGEALTPLKDRLDGESAIDLLEDLGLRVPHDFLTAGAIQGALSNGAAAAQQLATDIMALANAIDNADKDDLSSIAAMIEAATRAIASISALVTAIKALGNSMESTAALLPADARDTVNSFIQDFHRRLTDHLLLERIDFLRARTSSLIALTGIVDAQLDRGAIDNPLLIPHQLRRMRLKKLGKLINDPLGWFAEFYGWGQPNFDGLEILQRVANLFDRRDLVSLTPTFDGRFSLEGAAATLRVGPDPTDSSAPDGLLLNLWRPAVRDWNEEILLSGPWSFFVDTKARYEAGIEAGLFLPLGRLVLRPATGDVHADIGFGFRAERTDGLPMNVIGLAGATRLEVSKVEARAGLRLAGATPLTQVEATPAIDFTLEGLNCVLDLADGDGFLKSISGGGRGKSEVTIGARWSLGSGLKFIGSAALEIAIPAHSRIGPATIETVYVIGGFNGEDIALEISASLRGELGPFTAVADRIGVKLNASFPDEGGNLGPVQLDAGFKPPSGLGLSIDGGGFSGGGFLRRDPATGQYAGALELVFQDEIQVKAFGVLDTKAEGTLSGYSLIVIVSAEFAPIQLSFGFTLTGVGGLLGVERTASIDQLKLGLRDGSIQSILFPKDLVANAPRIIADLKRLFPPQGGRYLVGPMAKIGWGSPTLVTVEIGAILELPRPGFVILGVLRLAAPPAVEDVPVLDLQVNFLGVIDFLRGELSFDATLYNSRLLTFTLTGDMAARLYLRGENASLLLTVGGFHPSYTPPPMNLPTLQRLTISLFQGNPRLTAEGYFAVTANTLQFGCKIELYYGVSIFNVYGFVSLDALVQYIPPYFIAEIAGQLAVRSGGSTLFAIHLVLTLTGPTPFHARGKGSFEIGFIFTVTISASFDVTFGVERLFSVLAVSLLELIDEVLHDDGAWRAIAVPVSQRGVATRELSPGAGLVVSPTGSLTVSQKAAPLNLPLARVGAARVEGANRISIVDVSLGTSADPPTARPVQEQFAAAQFLDMNDAGKLSRRSFEPFDSGVEIGGGGTPKADFQTKVDVAYEVVYVRKPWRRPKLFYLADTALDLLLGGSAAARSKRSATKRKPTGVGTPPVALAPERFVVAGIDDLALHTPGLEFTSENAAVIALAGAVARNPRLKGKLQVISSYEAAA